MELVHSHPHLRILSTKERRECKDALECAVSHLCTGTKVEVGNALRITHAGVWIECSRDLYQLDSLVKSKSEMLHISCRSVLINSLNQPNI